MKKVSNKPLTYVTTMTQKGQITIPQEVRQAMDLGPDDRVEFEFEPKQKEVVMRKVKTILDFAGIFPAVPGKPIDKAREAMEKNYERF